MGSDGDEDEDDWRTRAHARSALVQFRNIYCRIRPSASGSDIACLNSESESVHARTRASLPPSSVVAHASFLLQLNRWRAPTSGCDV